MKDCNIFMRWQSEIENALQKEIESITPDDLLSLLQEQHPIYYQKGSNEVAFIRAHLLSFFEPLGAQDDALPFALEELENGTHPVGVAAAAQVLRARAHPYLPAAPLLIGAFQRLQHDDDIFSFKQLKSNKVPEPTTGMQEILKTIKWYGLHMQPWLPELKAIAATEKAKPLTANRILLFDIINQLPDDCQDIDDCCTISGQFSNGRQVHKVHRENMFKEIVLHDQSGHVLGFEDFFSKKPTVLAFFYTRCDNPQKCSLTISRLALLQKKLEELGQQDSIQIAAISYDSSFDTAPLLKRYGENRGIRFSNNVRFLRVQQGFAILQDYLDLNVNFVGPLVNRHAIELYLLDNRGKVFHVFKRIRWDQDAVISKIIPKVQAGQVFPFKKTRLLSNVSSGLIYLAMILFPKCPLCLGAYLSAVGITGVNTQSLSPWLRYILLLAVALNISLVYLRARKRSHFLPFYFSLFGGLLLVLNFLTPYQSPPLIGLLLVMTGSILNALPLYHFKKTIALMKNWRILIAKVPREQKA